MMFYFLVLFFFLTHIRRMNIYYIMCTGLRYRYAADVYIPRYARRRNRFVRNIMHPRDYFD